MDSRPPGRRSEPDSTSRWRVENTAADRRERINGEKETKREWMERYRMVRGDIGTGHGWRITLSFNACRFAGGWQGTYFARYGRVSHCWWRRAPRQNRMDTSTVA